MSKLRLKPLLQVLLLTALATGVILPAQAQSNGLETGEAVFEVLASEIALQRGEASLERDGKVVTAVDADSLVQNTLGLPLPARGLSDWLRGQIRPGSNASVERNSKGQVSKIDQDGWNLIYSWDDSNRLEKLLMTRSSNVGSIDIRLVFNRPND